MPQVTWIDLPALLTDVVANFVANVCAGILFAIFAAAVLWLADRELGILGRARERKERRLRDMRRAVRHLELLSEEVSSLLEKIPKWRDDLTNTRWGQVFIISTPAWDSAHLSGELARLVEPELLEGLVQFYDGLACTERWLPLLAQSWLVSENEIDSPEGKRTALIAMAVGGLAQAGEVGHTLMWRVESEITRLNSKLPRVAKDAHARHSETVAAKPEK